MQQLKKIIKKPLKYIASKMPFLFEDYGYMPGHYYSTIPSLEEVENNKKRIFENEEIKDIDLRIEEQFQFAQELKKYHDTIPYTFDQSNESRKKPDSSLLRYNPEGAYYRYSDA